MGGPRTSCGPWPGPTLTGRLFHGRYMLRGVSYLQLAAIVKNRLKSIQHRPTLIEGFLAQTGLTLEPETAPDDRPWPFNLCSSATTHLGRAA